MILHDGVLNPEVISPTINISRFNHIICVLGSPVKPCLKRERSPISPSTLQDLVPLWVKSRLVEMWFLQVISVRLMMIYNDKINSNHLRKKTPGWHSRRRPGGTRRGDLDIPRLFWGHIYWKFPRHRSQSNDTSTYFLVSGTCEHWRQQMYPYFLSDKIDPYNNRRNTNNKIINTK